MSTLEYPNKSKKINSTIVISGVFSIIFFGLGIAGLIGAFSDLEYKLVRILFWLYGAIFLAATVCLHRNQIKLGTRFMIAGSIITMPVGIIALLFAVKERRRVTNVDADGIILIILASLVVTLFTTPLIT